MSEWHPIETAPIEQFVILWNRRGVLLGYQTDRRGLWKQFNVRLEPQPTHWIPWPDPPLARAESDVPDRAPGA